ncbi:aminopeptidase P family protein [Rivibacter subsaxonicus]|uniref:Xaa-Pro aminopeptidase n=1 Tax=Rivibacter subsaxonicus TaxID=457575 RepID=A0A4Q7W122_9BURK|nr:aminopeptidase P family protein [Rivibacter subsaxonicus]RZU02901.1 Xaa-Pro aminopeptidase [Rivibacter subsaxonicus]
MDTLTSPIRLRLDHLREALAEHAVAAVLIPSSDPHLSEYLPGHWQGRAWFSGFTGSMATLVVTPERAALFADSRYWVQAEAELAGSGIELVKIATGASTEHVQWLALNTPRGQTVAVDGAVIGLAAAGALRTTLEAAGVVLRTDLDLVGLAWPERPALPAAKVYEHLAPQATESRGERLASVRAAMAARGATHHLVSTLDDLAWLFNLRGADVDYNPVFLAHALIGPSQVELFIGAGKIDAALGQRLAADGVQLRPYENARTALAALAADAVLLLDPRRVTLALREAVAAGVPVVEAINPSTLAKSRKSAAEAVHIREAMARDGAAMCAFYAWFESALGKQQISELTIDEHLSAERAKQPGYVSLSFPVIAGFNANGAMPHYRATPDSHALISTPNGVVADGLLLIDSGAQYLGGTTDITRVWPIGTPSAAMKRDYTLVLKGTIALSRTRFPRGTPSPMLDAIARAPIWAQSLEYGHGTGHGVGYFLNVHEGPQSISKAVPTPEMAMEPGMITSIEPGLYRPGRWGVRIENLVFNVAAPADEFGEFLEFESLTLCPIDTRCIDLALLNGEERDWLNSYHHVVRERLAPLVDGAALAWLRERTEAI